MRRVLKIIAPLGTIVFGMILRLVLIDKVPPDRAEFLKENYARSLWIDLLIASGILLIGPLINNHPRLPRQAKQDLFSVFMVVLACCLLMVTGFPKLGIAAELTTIWIPLWIMLAFLVTTGAILANKT